MEESDERGRLSRCRVWEVGSYMVGSTNHWFGIWLCFRNCRRHHERHIIDELNYYDNFLRGIFVIMRKVTLNLAIRHRGRAQRAAGDHSALAKLVFRPIT
jgi:hypothetical protein